jgi:hypothetical protein
MKELIDRIIANFDFGKVHEAMKALNWRWGSVGGVPSIGVLVTRAQELLHDVSNMDIGCSIKTGGFKAKKIESDDYGDGLELEFILTSQEYYEKWLDEE